jgi:ubiquitin carboxyl-terminal hydrolase 7
MCLTVRGGIPVALALCLLALVATHRFNADEGDWGFTRFCELRRLFSTQWEGRGIPLVQNDEAKITAYVRVVKDPTGVLWRNLQKYVSPYLL